MASTTSKIEDVSDKNCQKGCWLQYGVSEVFERILQEQKKLKALKSHIQPKTFSDPKDRAFYSHMLNDLMMKRGGLNNE